MIGATESTTYMTMMMTMMIEHDSTRWLLGHKMDNKKADEKLFEKTDNSRTPEL